MARYAAMFVALKEENANHFLTDKFAYGSILFKAPKNC